MKTLLRLAFVSLAAVTLLSCNKGRETEGDFGQEFSVDEVNSVFSKAVDRLDPSKIKVGESVTHIVSLRVENSERFRPVFWDRSTILSKVDTSDRLSFNVKTEEKDLSVDPPEEKVYEDEMTFKKVSHVTQMNSEFSAKATSKPESIKYYNLKHYPMVLDAPEEVKKKANCLGLQDCKMNINHVEFDEVTWYKDGTVKKIKWTYEVSPDVPYLAAMTTVCAAQLIDYEGSKVYVRNCRYAVDFNF